MEDGIQSLAMALVFTLTCISMPQNGFSCGDVPLRNAGLTWVQYIWIQLEVI